jgi:hypothetical protein
MKKIKKIKLLLVLLTALFFVTSCEKELYEEVLTTNQVTGKAKPDIKVNSLNFSKNHPTLQKLKQKTQNKFKSYRTTQNIEHNTLDGFFGEVKLDYGVEVIDSLNRKTTTFEVKETNPTTNVYYNFVIQNDTDLWLYKIEKIENQYKSFPANSTIVSRFSLNENLSMSSPCDSIVFPPFGYYEYEDLANSGGAGGGYTIGNINNPNDGIGYGLGAGFGSGFFNGVGSGSSGSVGSSSGGDGSSGGGPSLALIEIGDFFTDAWNWIKDLFGGGCNCPQRVSNGGSEDNLVATGGGVVLEIKDNPCGEGGYVIITPQDEYVDKIIEFENYISYLHNNDKVFLYSNPQIVDELEEIIQANSSNANLMAILPELISKTRKNEITWEFARELIDYLIINDDIENYNFVNEVFNLFNTETTNTNNALNFVLQAQIHNKIENDLDEAFLESVNQYVDLNTTDPIVTRQLIIYFSVRCAILKYQNPSWSNGKIYWEASKDLVHISLDLIGLVPLFGEPADLINGILYTIEGDGVNATLSYASTIPLAGWVTASTKIGLKVINVAGETTELVWKVVGNVIEFGERKQLRRVLGITDSSIHAHHLIPWATRTKTVVQKAAKSGNTFHLNEALNGIPLNSTSHLTGHAQYTQKLEEILDFLHSNNQNMTPNQAYTHINNLTNQIRTHIINHPNYNLGQISNLIVYP